MGRNIENKKRIGDLEMKIVITNCELPKYECRYILDGRNMKPIDENQFKEWLLWMDEEYIKKWLPYEDSEIYFVNVNETTWNKFKTKNSKRLHLKTIELMKLIHESSLLILIEGLIEGSRIKACMYYPWRNRII